jgi:hypothetical protein
LKTVALLQNTVVEAHEKDGKKGKAIILFGD